MCAYEEGRLGEIASAFQLVTLRGGVHTENSEDPEEPIRR